MDNPEKLAIQDKRQRQTKPKHNTLCVRHHYSQQNTTHYVLDTTIHNKTKQNTTHYVLDTTIHNKTKQNIKKDMSSPTSNWR
jgi:hypothetical protein